MLETPVHNCRILDMKKFSWCMHTTLLYIYVYIYTYTYIYIYIHMKYTCVFSWEIKLECEQKWLPFCRLKYLIAFSWKKIFVFWLRFHWILFLSRVQLTISIDSGKCLVPNRQQAITWTDANHIMWQNIRDSKVHGANMGPTLVLSAPAGPYVGPMNLAIRDGITGSQ